MPRLLLSLMLVMLTWSGQAQSFNKRYKAYDIPFTGPSFGSFGFSVEVDQLNGDIIVFFNGGWQDTLFYSSKLGMLRLASDGTPLDTNMYPLPLHATYAGWSDASFKRADGSFVVGGSVRSVIDGIRKTALFFFDASGVPDSSYVIEMGPVTWIGRHAIETSDGNFLVCGETAGAGADGFMMKISPVGDTLWTWAGGGPSTDYATAVAEGADGRYYMGGKRYLTNSTSNLWVKAFDQQGEVLWDTIWGSAFHEGVAYLTAAADGSVLVASGHGTQGNHVVAKYLARLAPADGAIIWQRTYGSGSYDSPLFVVKELSNGDLIGGGTHVLNNDYTGVLLRTTSTGDSLWMRYYYYEDSITTNGRGVFRDVEPTPDGGFVAVGTAFSDANYSQDVWVVKVDKHGCMEPGCHIITGMETQITNMRDALKVWPNPAANGGDVWVEVTLPEHLAAKELWLTLTSSEGRAVHVQRIATPLSLGKGKGVRVNCPQLSPGFYHLHLTAGSTWVSGAKLVVE